MKERQIIIVEWKSPVKCLFWSSFVVIRPKADASRSSTLNMHFPRSFFLSVISSGLEPPFSRIFFPGRVFSENLSSARTDPTPHPSLFLNIRRCFRPLFHVGFRSVGFSQESRFHTSGAKKWLLFSPFEPEQELGPEKNSGQGRKTNGQICEKWTRNSKREKGWKTNMKEAHGVKTWKDVRSDHDSTTVVRGLLPTCVPLGRCVVQQSAVILHWV